MHRTADIGDRAFSDLLELRAKAEKVSQQPISLREIMELALSQLWIHDQSKEMNWEAWKEKRKSNGK